MDSEPSGIRKHVAVLGLSHASSRTELRDRLLFSGPKLEAALQQLAGVEMLQETFLLSTCNRVEIYAVVEDPAAARARLLRFFSEFHGVPVEEFEAHAYFYHCHQAIEHFFRVISSLDSMVLGEDQILGQVKEAYRSALHLGNTGTMINKLFHFGVETGKRVRTETRIGDGVLSVASVAVDLAQKILGDLKTRTALVIGAGEMSELTARHLTHAGIKKIHFANRTLENALDIAGRFGGEALLLDEREQVLPECDIVISSTGAPGYIITPDEIRRVMEQRKHRALFLIDIAAPRDIHPEVDRIQNVFVYSIDDLSLVVAENSQLRAGKLEAARAIIAEDLEKYFEWYRSLRSLPVLINLRRRFERECEEELERYADDIDALPEESRQVIRQFAASLTKRFLREPSRVLREVAADRQAGIFTDAVVNLFNLKVPHDG